MEPTTTVSEERKVCKGCNKKRVISMFSIRKDRNTRRRTCKICARLDKKKARQKKILAGICIKCPRPVELGHVHCSKCLKKTADRQLAFKKMVFSKYGGVCKCCGESIIHFLTIDHVFGDGNKHRKETKGGGSKSYYWLKRNNFPQEGFQVLCYNCNCGRQVNGGICPHHEEEYKPKINVPRGLTVR